TEALVAEWGGDRVGVRLAPTNPFNDIADSNPAATFGLAVGELKRFGLAYLHIVEPLPSDPVASAERPDIKFFRRIWPGTLMGNKGYALARANARCAKASSTWFPSPPSSWPIQTCPSASAAAHRSIRRTAPRSMAAAKRATRIIRRCGGKPPGGAEGPRHSGAAARPSPESISSGGAVGAPRFGCMNRGYG